MALNEEQKKLLKEMWRSAYGRALLDFLEEEFLKIGDITTVKSWEEAQGRQQAVILIKKLFSFMYDNKQPDKKLNTYE